MEACGSAHHWARRIAAAGHDVRLLPAHYVKAYVKRNKTDRADAAALIEAARCAEIKAVPVKTVEQQQIQALHRCVFSFNVSFFSLRMSLRKNNMGWPVKRASKTRARDLLTYRLPMFPTDESICGAPKEFSTSSSRKTFADTLNAIMTPK
jgi:hypothetical protein